MCSLGIGKRSPAALAEALAWGRNGEFHHLVVIRHCTNVKLQVTADNLSLDTINQTAKLNGRSSVGLKALGVRWVEPQGHQSGRWSDAPFMPARYGLGENEQQMLFVVFDLEETQLAPGSDMPDHGQRSLPLGLIRLQLEDC